MNSPDSLKALAMTGLRYIFTMLAFCAGFVHAAAQKYVGGDISLLPEYEKAGAAYYTHAGSAITDVLGFFKAEGWNAMRVRLFVNPSDYTASDKANVCQDLDYVKALGKRIKDAGFKLMLDFHYSDGWADPGKQWTPAAWVSLNDARLGRKLYDYTKDVLRQMKEAGAEPDFVQTGNEISYGMLWGAEIASAKYYCYPSSSASNWARFTNLLQQATKATCEECPNAKVIIHVERVSTSQQKDNANYAALENFFRKMAEANIDYDVIGLSYYPCFHGTIEELEGAVSYLETAYPAKNIMVVEAGYPYAWEVGGTIFDYTGKYAYSDEGQKAFTDALIAMLNRHGHVNGLFWWWPEYNARGTSLSGWYNAPLFDSRTGCATSALSELKLFKGEASGIKPLHNGNAVADDNYYNLNGQVANTPLRGVFIHGGKKIVKE